MRTTSHAAQTVPLGAPDAPGTMSGWRHFPWRFDDLKRFAAVYAVLTVILVALGALIVHVLGDGPLGELDLNVADWFADQRSHTVNNLAQIGAGVADAYTLIPAFVIVTVLLVVVFKRWNEAVFLVTAILMEKAVFVTTTYIVSRDRPPVGQLDGAPPTSSYPSGHVAAAVVFYAGLAIIIAWHARHVLVRALVWTVAIVVPVIVAVSRMILGMHFFSDVVVGAALGVVSLILGAWLARRTLCDLDRRTEAKQASAERDRTQREPRRPEAQSGEGVAGPVHAEQHS